jgi:exodeoxyribonuclease V alpha subunit
MMATSIEPIKEFKLTGVLKKVLYKNNETSYCIAVLDNNQKVCGQYFDTDIEKLVGEEIILVGNWVHHKKYGVQFAFEKLELKEAELFFFLTKIVKGITKKTATELFAKYSEEELVAILDNNPSELLSFKGIKEKKLALIVSSWQKFKHLRQLGSFLAKYKVSSTLITKIYSHFSEVENLIDKIKHNPYVLTQVKGVGFKRADEIALNLGLDVRSDFRIAACMSYILKEYCDNNGNSSIAKSKLFALLNDALKFNDETALYEKALHEMLAKEEIYETTNQRYALSMFYFAETQILHFFKERKEQENKKIVANLQAYLDNKQQQLGFSLSSEQQKAVEIINNGSNTLFLIGYAGTGKSTSSRSILQLLEEIVAYDDIITIALSGIASQRIAETTGYNSMTIQSLLVKSKEQDYFPYKVILLDEASMVNSVTFYQIISKIAPETIFIIVGDDGQLPAIGAGNILHDAIKYELAPICKLTKIYRQNEHQAIALIANEIRQGEIPQYKEQYDDFEFHNVSISNYYAAKNSQSQAEFSNVRFENTQRILHTILNISSTYIKPMYEAVKKKNIAKALTLFQVITPMKGGILGVENLNIQLQKLFNASRQTSKKCKLYEYKLSDKVIHIKNENMKSQSMDMYKKGVNEFVERRVFNGQLGMIIKLDFENEQCVVLYPNDDMVVFYTFDAMDSLLSLAYCLTIHKTQGMEYDNALIPMSFSHYIMHNTKLLYTAVTRAKKMCHIVGEEEAFVSACKRIETTKRESVINDILKPKSN